MSDQVAKMIASLRSQVEAAQQELDMALCFREAWLPAAFNSDLHQRIGTSYSANTFLIIRSALRREMILALMRLWDTDRHAIRLQSISNILSDVRVINTLGRERASSLNLPGVQEAMTRDLQERAQKACAIIRKYGPEQPGEHVLESLRRLRHEVLAHRQVSSASAPRTEAEESDVDQFVQDMADLIPHLMTVAKATSYNPQETADVFRRHAELFWAGVKGERTEGHPQYRAIPVTGQI